jgi:hypothetical protein
VSDQPKALDGRLPARDGRKENGQIDDAVGRLTSEVMSLKLELATLTSALRELQSQQAGRRMTVPTKAIGVTPPIRPSMTPAAIVVLIAAGLLSWQVIATPRVDRAGTQAGRPAPSPARVAERTPITLPPVDETAPATEPPVTPLVKPTIYKGTLSVRADSPGAQVFVNRKAVGTAPVRVGNLRAGAHLVWVESDGYRRWTRVVTVPAETVTRVTADLEPEPVIER